MNKPDSLVNQNPTVFIMSSTKQISEAIARYYCYVYNKRNSKPCLFSFGDIGEGCSKMIEIDKALSTAELVIFEVFELLALNNEYHFRNMFYEIIVRNGKSDKEMVLFNSITSFRSNKNKYIVSTVPFTLPDMLEKARKFGKNEIEGIIDAYPSTFQNPH